MDSLTQFTLGAAVSAVILGKKIGPRKAALIGGVLGTLPDLDVLLPFDSPVDEFVFHRGWSHSFFVHAFAAPVFGEMLVRGFKALRDYRFQTWFAVFLIFSTHAIIDAMTVYGTRIFWPLYPDPVGIGSIFIIDPLYTIPILIMVIWSLVNSQWSKRLQTGLVASLIISSAYMGLSYVLQGHIERRAEAIFEKAGIAPNKILGIAAPFNTVLWRVIGQEDDRFHNLYISLFDNDANAKIYTHPTRPELGKCISNTDAFKKLEWFSRGYYELAVENGKVIMTDLRMGLTPSYVFRFAIANYQSQQFSPIPAESVGAIAVNTGQDLDWLTTRFAGNPMVRAAEASALGANSRIESNVNIAC